MKGPVWIEAVWAHLQHSFTQIRARLTNGNPIIAGKGICLCNAFKFSVVQHKNSPLSLQNDLLAFDAFYCGQRFNSNTHAPQDLSSIPHGFFNGDTDSDYFAACF